MAEVTLEQLYLRALRILGVRTPGGRQLTQDLSITPVAVISDVSDASLPHQNPLFGGNIGIAAVAAEFNAFALTASARLLRVRFVNVIDMTSPRIQVFGTQPITTVVSGPSAGLPIGPEVGVSTARVSAGNSAVANTSGLAFRPTISQFDILPPFLIAPGHTLLFEDQSANQNLNVAMIWEEIPLETDVANIGFPTALTS